MDDNSRTSSVDIRADGVDCNVNIGGTGLAVIWIMVALAIMIVVTRLYTQARITKQFGPSDYLMLCSIIVITTFASLISVQYHYGWGRHQSCITDIQELETQIKYNVTGQCFGIMGSTFGRLSFIVFMVKLFGSKRWVWWLLWTMFVAQVVTNLGTAITIYTQCKDPRALYDFSMPYDLCWPAYVETYLGWAHTSFNGLCDAVLAVLPATMVWKLNMARRLKVGLAVLLGMSAVALVGLVMKCVYLDALSYEGDYSYNTVPMFTWVIVEGTLVAMAASVPLLRPLAVHVSKQRTSKATNTYDLPQYAVRSGQTDSSGLSKLGNRVRTSVKGGNGNQRSVYPLDSDSDENLLVLQQAGAGKKPEVAAVQVPRNGRIVVRQEYTVTSEAKGEREGRRERLSGDAEKTAAFKGPGRMHTRRPSTSGYSVASAGEPRPPPPAVWSKKRSSGA